MNINEILTKAPKRVYCSVDFECETEILSNGAESTLVQRIEFWADVVSLVRDSWFKKETGITTDIELRAYVSAVELADCQKALYLSCTPESSEWMLHYTDIDGRHAARVSVVFS